MHSSGHRSAHGLLLLQLELECKAVTERQTIVRIPCSEPDEIARVLVVRDDTTYTVYCAEALPQAIRQRIMALPPAQVFLDRHTVLAVLADDAPCRTIWVGTSYVFPELPPAVPVPEVVRLADERHAGLLQAYEHWSTIGDKTVYGLIQDGHIVASCGSARENSTSGEAWVITEPDYRRRGYGRRVAVAWARDLQRQGKVAFYSHVETNRPSQALATSLRLRRFMDGVGYD